MSKIAIIGSGFSGLSAASFMAKDGHNVTVYEKNSSIGGRARAFTEQGFTFDMGPSWYWMPDVFEKFFGQFGKHPSDYYQLTRLDPGFQVIFGKDDVLTIPAGIDEIYNLFEGIEKGSADNLRKFLSEAAIKYRISMDSMIYKPSLSWSEFMTYEVMSKVSKLHMFKSVSTHVRNYFKDERLIALMEFPVLFLGAMATQVPALYSIMNYAAFSLGTWYPMGGMIEVIKGMQSLATSMGVNISTDCAINTINVQGNRATSLHTQKGNFSVDGIIATGDYHHMEQALLEEPNRNYTEKYWDKKILAPSSLIFYLGVNKKIDKLAHHNLFFDQSIDDHSSEIYIDPKWPENPLFYACCPSRTDASVAPDGMENLFILIPIAPGLEDTPEIREHYFDMVLARMEKLCGASILPHIIYKKSYCITDFERDYHAYKGNAYGLANTLRQTAVFKPSIRNKKVTNLFYAGQLTVPGPGVPPAIISGQIAAEQLIKSLK